MGINNKIHSNNFDALRFIFASFVIITHSFALLGDESKDWLARLSGNQISFSYIGLRGFFIISGFLVFQSLERSHTIFDFIWKRFLRIFPGLIAVGLVMVLLIGPITTTLKLNNYFFNKETFYFFSHTVTLLYNTVHRCLPGVFERNIHGCEVNGSLWTITYEFLFYIGISFLFYFRKLYIKRFFLFAAIGIIYFLKIKYVIPHVKYEYYIANTAIGLKAATDFGSFFILGSLFASFKFDKLSKKQINITLFISSGILLLLTLLGYYTYFPVILVPIVLAISFSSFRLFPFIKKTGDISYGTYLYGFVIQQILIQYFHLEVYTLIVVSLLIAYVAGYFSWHYVEKPFLKFKDAFSPAKKQMAPAV